jgi:hypothetical protein
MSAAPSRLGSDIAFEDYDELDRKLGFLTVDVY